MKRLLLLALLYFVSLLPLQIKDARLHLELGITKLGSTKNITLYRIIDNYQSASIAFIRIENSPWSIEKLKQILIIKYLILYSHII